jgi:colanic acid biosynthesis glycosyl transferase WcaI
VTLLMRVLILNQTFHPDVVSTAQHASDLALELTKAGHHVSVICGARAYDDPTRTLVPRETWDGVEIYRVAGTGFGKAAKWRRFTDFATFLANCTARVLCLPKFELVIAMTSPPLISWIAAQLVPWKATRLAVWSMDLNPDEAIAAGWLRASSMPAKFLSARMNSSLRRADRIIALDRFMQGRIAAKGIAMDKIVVVPPWPHDQHVEFDPVGREQFRADHDLRDKFVVMYSGNHSPCHPLDTLLEAARRLESRRDIVFYFIGGGTEFRKIQTLARESGASNIRCLPYQPLTKLAGSLSAADLHVVVMGESFVGIVHPCKIYNILAVGLPILYIGPQQSHVSDIVSLCRIERWIAASQHGQVEKVVNQILKATQAVVAKPAYSLPQQFSRSVLLEQMIGALEESSMLGSKTVHAAAQSSE